MWLNKKFIFIVLLGFGLHFMSVSMAAPFDRFLMPGKLVDAHKKYERTCDVCHEAFDKQKQDRLCLKCHKKINEDVTAKKGFHSRSQLVSKRECKFCHTDHIGRKENIVHLDKLGFNHKNTDFHLKGAHKKTTCESCHFPEKKYREAPTACYDCHEKNDIHLLRMGKKCQDCHSEINWIEAKFDHDKTKYKLKGKHKKTPCGDCHPNQRYKSTPKLCNACHQVQDIHRGEFGAKCEKCHESVKWTKIRFNHDKDTKFKLKYRHAKISCGSCHVKNAYKVKLKKTCFSCHKADDKHNLRYSEKCEKCHQDKSWDKILFDHDKDTKFRLLDSHKEVGCQNCHEGNVYKDKLKVSCDSCHNIDDVHNGKLGGKCAYCHDQKKWSGNIIFEHDLTDFPLIGLHGITSCESCHSSSEYKVTSLACVACHKVDDAHELKLTSKCETCHTPNGWKVWFFSHDEQTDYDLDGEHKLLECVACHQQAIKGTKKIVLSDRCESCHMDDDVHSGQFGKRCGKCHSTDAFKNITILD